jgi:glutaredoxin 2
MTSQIETYFRGRDYYGFSLYSANLDMSYDSIRLSFYNKKTTEYFQILVSPRFIKRDFNEFIEWTEHQIYQIESIAHKKHNEDFKSKMEEFLK